MRKKPKVGGSGRIWVGTRQPFTHPPFLFERRSNRWIEDLQFGIVKIQRIGLSTMPTVSDDLCASEIWSEGI